MKVVIISGISGSGKSTFLRALEDAGFFCVDNFPIILMQGFLKVCESPESNISKVAFVVDIRTREFFDKGKKIIKDVKEEYNAEFVFLESSDDVLIRRFSETRRIHPIYDSYSVKEALKEEREAVEWLKKLSNKVIDTSQLTTHELRRVVMGIYAKGERGIKINLMSFGFSFGIPLEADMVFDVRFLPNPYFVEGLKEMTGLNDAVGDYIRSDRTFNEYFLLLSNFLLYLIPLFEKEGKSYLTISIGCTGGKHRSVFVTRELEKTLSSKGYNITTIHRDVNR
ncbi:MAG: RNase adapter RapZ [Syntrophorhabdaceae bacterium]|nr:RNase adapter RapZ [Syntrophorhabdaceae bacterium]